ncbi:MAG: 6-phosphofructokinase [Saprospiraceae bacterium]|nr:6-phosphofructokinase [Saprospiraceae bacterium]
MNPNSAVKRVGLFTSGGDSPGMNAAIRAVVRSCIYYDLDIYGIRRGYAGMIEGDIFRMNSRSVSGIIQRGGTILKSARSMEFKTKEGRQKAFDNISKHDIDSMVVIGGDGSFRGAQAFEAEHGVKMVGVPGTIDNDLFGTDYTIGYDTATNTAVDAIDKIKDTADAHDRLFFVEVMGRDAGFIALKTGISCGAEAIMIPEDNMKLDELIDILKKGRPSKNSSIVVVAEGDNLGGAFVIAEKVKEQFQQYETKVTILGHLQRGGSPSCFDRVLASRLGLAAVEALMAGKSGIMVGQVHSDIIQTPLEQATKHGPRINQDLLRLAKIISI